MKRAPVEAFGDDPFDILVVGGGIYGLMAAHDAALRGLRTALVERADFGGRTSQNSLKLMHGGIRYVQHLDFARLRASARERAYWQWAAPSLVRPLEFTIPLFGHGIKGPEAFAAAAALYNLATTGLRGPHYAGARVVGPSQARCRLGAVAPDDITGGGVWSDGQIQDVSRLHMACLRAGTEAGVMAANYMDARALISEGGRVTGARLYDRLTGAEAEVRAHVTLSCTGAAAARLAGPHLGTTSAFPRFLRATNLVVDRQIGPHAVGVVSRAQSDAVIERGGRMYFLTPWNGHTILGTHEAPSDGAVSAKADVDDFLDEFALACPALSLTRSDVIWVHQGLIPADVDDARNVVRRHTRGSLLDHSETGLGGLISVTGVKYTTARLIAERAVDRATRQFDRPFPASTSARTPLPVSQDTAPELGDKAAIVMRLRSARETEMACSLEDVVERRTCWAESGLTAGQPAQSVLSQAAKEVGLGQRSPC